MPLNWDDDDEDLTELEYRKRPSRVLIHEEVTTPLGDAREYQRWRSPPETPPPPPKIAEPLRAPQEVPAPAPRTPTPLPFTPAPARDRFAALLLDSLIAFYLYWLVGFLLIRFFNSPNLILLHQSTGRLSLHIGLTALLVFFYYVLMESVFGATLGKFFCRLRVIEENGQSASLGNVFIRNFLRIVDYPLGFLIAVIAMESSPYQQRLGDRAAKTLVIKKSRRQGPLVDLAHTPLASTLSRLFAETVDLFLALTLLYGCILLMNVNRPYFSFVLYVSLPVIFILYYTLLEFLTGTTPGKAFFKRRVILENGEPLDGTGSLIRNLFRPLDYLLGYPLLVITKRKQRLGDLAADTLVIAQPSGKSAWLGFAVVFFLIFTVVYLGVKNPNNPIRREYGLKPLEGLKIFIPKLRPSPQKMPSPPSVSDKPNVPSSAPLPASTSDQLKYSEFDFAAGPSPAMVTKEKIFRTGDLVFAYFKVQGFAQSPLKEIYLVQDLQVEGPDGKVILNQPEIVKFNKTLEEETPSIVFANNIKLPKGSPPGKYRAIFTIRDQVAGTQFSFDEHFELQ